MPDTPPVAVVDLAGVAARFGSRLHELGIATAPDRAGRFATAVALARPATTRELYWLGRVTLTGTPVEIAGYDRVFNDVFRGLVDIADRRGERGNPDLQALERGRSRPTTTNDHVHESAGGNRPPPAPIGGNTDDRNDDDRDDDNDDDRAAPTAAPASGEEILRARDFADCTLDELAALRRLVTGLAVAAPIRQARRRRRHRSGDRIDRRATLRRARRTGGDPAELVRRRRTVRPRPVVLIADVSASMESYSRAYLYLLHGAVRALRAETFVFATRLTRLTRTLRVREPEVALAAAVGDTRDWSGGTRIGDAVGEFNDRWGRRGLARGAVVVIVSDGWDGGDPAVLGEQMARLARLAHHVVWVNPRAKSDRYQPLVGGMAAALPHVDTFASGHSLDAFGDVLAAIATA
jgi:uncharacterized protein